MGYEFSDEPMSHAELRERLLASRKPSTQRRQLETIAELTAEGLSPERIAGLMGLKSESVQAVKAKHAR